MFYSSLFMEFTITETFSYFGRLLKMAADEVDNRREKLLQLLELPVEDRQVGRPVVLLVYISLSYNGMW